MLGKHCAMQLSHWMNATSSHISRSGEVDEMTHKDAVSRVDEVVIARLRQLRAEGQERLAGHTQRSDGQCVLDNQPGDL